MTTTRIIIGDVRVRIRELPDESVHCVVTSPPYFGLRDYGVNGQIGLEETPNVYVSELVSLFRDVRRVLRSDGTFWLNLGDSYAGHGRMVNDIASSKGLPSYKNGPSVGRIEGFARKQLIGIPWRVAFALQDDGWWLRQDVIWRKTFCKHEQAADRPGTAHEHLFLFAKSLHYSFDRPALGKACDRSVWDIAPANFKGAHFATFPPDLIRPCILAGCPEDGTVLDPFFGAGTTALVAQQLGRNCVGIELNPKYVAIACERLGISNTTDRLHRVQQWNAAVAAYRNAA